MADVAGKVLPSGTTTFLFTDVEGSSTLWDEAPAEMAAALEQHDRLLRSTILDHGGYVFSTAGDAFSAAFGTAHAAVDAAVEAQQRLAAADWPAAAGIRVRMGLHSGEAQERDGDFFGPAVNRAARVMSMAHGGQVLVSAVISELLADDGSVALVDVGEHWLKGLRRRERLFDVVYEGRPEGDYTVVGAGPGDVVAAPVVQLVGREGDVAELGALVEDHRVVSLVGVGGIGKTTLAAAVARSQAGRFADGVRVVELAGLGSGESVAAAVAAALGVQPRAGMSVTESIIESYRDMASLIVLDNCEHVLDSAASLVAALAGGGERLRLLTTSREPLLIGGEYTVDVRPLSLAPPNADLDEIAESAAVQLFVERATEAGRLIDTADGDLMACVAELCRRLDGLPLAIELAAARTRSRTPSEVLAHLHDHERLLATRRRDVPERHRTLRDTIDWSYRLLDADEQQMFDRLSVFYGGFTLDAAAAVCSSVALTPDDVAELVWALAERSLLDVTDSIAESSRYAMLETLRQYASSHLDEGTARELADRHLAYFARLSGRAAPCMQGPEEPLWVVRLNAEFDNLRVAHTHAVETGQTDAAIDVVASLHDYAMWRQRFELGTWADATLAMAGTADSPQLPVLCATAGWGACIRGDYDGARHYARRGLDAERRAGAEPCGWLHDVLAHCDYFTGHNREGLQHSAAELARARQHDDTYRLAYVLADSAIHNVLAGDATLAAQLAEEAMQLALELGCPSLLGIAHLASSWCAVDTDPSSARRHALTVFEYGERLDAGWLLGTGAISLGILTTDHGDPASDLPRVRRAADTYRRAGDDVRVRTIYYWCLPAVAQLIGTTHGESIVALHHAIKERPVMTGVSIEARLGRVLDDLHDRLGDERFQAAVELGQHMNDRELTDHAIRLYDTAIAATRPA